MSKLKSTLGFLLFVSISCFASPHSTNEKWNDLYNQWMSIHFSHRLYAQKLFAFNALLNRIIKLHEIDQKAVQPMVLEALIYCSYAEIENGLGSLSYVNKARNLLKRAENLEPTLFEGTIYSTLGALYSQVPGWPISFGNNEIARQYLELALHLYPNAADTNYLYGDFLLTQGEPAKAYLYLSRAANAPIRPTQQLVDIHAKADAIAALNTMKK